MNCPSDEELRAFLEGPDEGSAELREHSASCPICRERLPGLDITAAGAPREAAPPSNPPLPRGAALGRFVVLSELGRGGMGVVYAAYDPVLERKVALKILRLDKLPPEHIADARARLLREAKSAARLSHPNVVAVYEAGAYGAEGIFVAMEHVEGQTLNDWQRAKDRPWRELVSHYTEAAAGLAAAHSAGIVHRDFKPANALVGKDGRVRVADFGLARANGSTPTRPQTNDDSDIPLRTVSSGDQLTRPGALIGTPAYMAPEQLSGREADDRSDQFAFAVALYEALSGERPFSGETLAASLELMRRGELSSPEKLKGPRALRRVLTRALAFDSAARYPSMDELSRVLRRLTRTDRKIWFVRGAAAVSLLALGAAVALRAPEVACEVKGAEIGATWNTDRRGALLAAWTGQANAPATTELERPLLLLDAYADGWRSISEGACDAALVKKVHSEELYDRQIACLGRLRRELDATLSVVERSQAADVSRAIEAVASLSPVLRCSADAVESQTRIDPPAAQLAAQVDELRARLAAVKAQRFFDSAGSLELGAEIVLAAQKLQYPPLHAEALQMVGELNMDLKSLEAAESQLEAAVSEAERAGYDEVRERAEISLASLHGFRNTRFKQGRHHLERAQALLQRMGRPLELEALLTTANATLLFHEGHYPQAHEHFLRTLELSSRLFGERHPRTSLARSNLAQSFKGMSQFSQAEAVAKHATQTLLQTVGAEHRWTRVAHYSLATIYARQGRGDEAIAEFSASDPDAKQGVVTPDNAPMQLRFATAHLHEDRTAQARMIIDAVERHFKAHPPEDQNLALEVVFARAELLYAEGRLSQGATLLEDRLIGIQKLRGPDAHATQEARLRLARVRLDLGELDAAELLLERVRAAAPSAFKPGDLMRSELEAFEGELHALRGQCDNARTLIDSALTAQQLKEPDPSRLARTRMAALLCPSSDAAAHEELRAELERQLAKPSGWARIIRFRLSSGGKAFVSPSRR